MLPNIPLQIVAGFDISCNSGGKGDLSNLLKSKLFYTWIQKGPNMQSSI